MSVTLAVCNDGILSVIGDDLVGADRVFLRVEHAALECVADIAVRFVVHCTHELRLAEVIVEDELPVGDAPIAIAPHLRAVKEPAAPLVALDKDPVAAP